MAGPRGWNALWHKESRDEVSHMTQDYQITLGTGSFPRDGKLKWKFLDIIWSTLVMKSL